MDKTCLRCGHGPEVHWPNDGGRSTTACVTCLDEDIKTNSILTGEGICTNRRSYVDGSEDAYA